MMTRVRRSRPPTRRPSPHNKTEGSPPDAYTTQMDLTEFYRSTRGAPGSPRLTRDPRVEVPLPIEGPLAAGFCRAEDADLDRGGTAEDLLQPLHRFLGIRIYMCGPIDSGKRFELLVNGQEAVQWGGRRCCCVVTALERAQPL